MSSVAPHLLPLAQRIVWARKRKGISQERLAGLIGTSRRHMIRIEKGQHVPGPEFRRRIAEATGQEIEFFLDGTPDSDDEEVAELMGTLMVALRAVVRREVAREGSAA